jgi:sugar phosphate isomerase/epimerase
MRLMNRRKFIANSVAATTALTTPLAWAKSARPQPATHSSASGDPSAGASAAADHQVRPIGVQLYTVRSMMKTDLPRTIAKVAAVGYTEVEMAGYFDHSPKEFRAILDSNGLKSPSSHIDYKVWESSIPTVIENAHTLGQQFLVCAFIDEAQRKEPGGWKRAADLFARAGEECKKAGIQFCYHNHTFEFEPSPTLGGKLPYDFFLETLDPNAVKMELDLCWINVAGADPIAYFNKYPGRFPLVHVKDWKGKGGTMADEATRLADVGQGNIDWKHIFANAGPAGIQHYFVENDAAKGIDDIRISYQYLKDLRF